MKNTKEERNLKTKKRGRNRKYKEKEVQLPI
jgi:hypothetical protein